MTGFSELPGSMKEVFGLSVNYIVCLLIMPWAQQLSQKLYHVGSVHPLRIESPFCALKLICFLKQDRQCMCNIALWCIHTIFIPHRLSKEHETISLDKNAFVAIYCYQQQQNILRSPCKMPDFNQKFETSQHIFIEISSIKFHIHAMCEQMDRQPNGRID